MDRLNQQLKFIQEIDKLKGILRKTLLMDSSRQENTAEHSWHLVVMAVLLHEHAKEKIDILKVLKMLAVHDIVEVDAGDTFAYDEKATKDKKQREAAAAKRIFNILPPDQAKEIHDLWDEFEERKTPEARFANAIDRLQPVMHNYHTKGVSWRENNVSKDRIIKRNKSIEDGSPILWKHAEELIKKAVEKEFINP